jgi:predicted transposase/invertase (TIGR01784 family)
MLRELLTKSHSGDILYVIPIIIYHGEKNWDVSIYLPLNRKLGSASKYAQNFNYEFFDISHIPDDQIRGSALLRIVFLTMKYIHNQQILNKLDDILVIFEEMSHEVNISNDLNTFALYIETAAPQNLKQQLSEKINSWERRDDMPEISKTFQRLKDEGKREGKIEDAQQMIYKGMSKELIQEITGLPVEKIVELEKNISSKKIPND